MKTAEFISPIRALFFLEEIVEAYAIPPADKAAPACWHHASCDGGKQR